MTDPNSPDAPQPGSNPPQPGSTPPPPPPPTEPTPTAPDAAPPGAPTPPSGQPTTPDTPPPGSESPGSGPGGAEPTGAEATEVMPITPPPPGAVGAEPGAAAGGAVPPGEDPFAPEEADDETPWYKTPLGIAGLVLGALLLVALLIWIFWGSGDDEDGEVVSASVELITVDETGAALDRGFFASAIGTGEFAESFVWLQPSEAPGPDDIGGTTGEDGRLIFEWAPAAEVTDPESWTSTIQFVESVPAGFAPPGPVVECVLSQPDSQDSTISMDVTADPPDASVDQVVTYTFPNHEFLPGDRVRCDLVSGLPPASTTTTTTTTTSTTTTTTVAETTTTAAPTTVAPTAAPTTAAPTTAAPTTVAPTTPPTPPATVIEALQAAGDYGDFLSAAAAFDSVTDLLEGSGPVTVFAPTDDALAAATLPADPDDLEQLLLSHIVDGDAFDAAAIFDGSRTEIDVASGGTQPVDQAADTVGGVAVGDPDLAADNGVAHGIDAVLPVAAP